MPKIHTQKDLGSPLQKLEKFLARELHPLVEQLKSLVRSLLHFISFMTLTLYTNDICDSLDVIFLYPNVPVDETLDKIAINEDVPAHIRELADHCPKNTECGPIGSALPVMSNLFMSNSDIEALNNALFKPKQSLKNVDDLFISGHKRS